MRRYLRSLARNPSSGEGIIWRKPPPVRLPRRLGALLIVVKAAPVTMAMTTGVAARTRAISATMTTASDEGEPPDTLVPDPQVWREFGICTMTGYRWTYDPTLNFPPPIKIRNRCFRSRKMLEDFKARMLRKAIRGRADAR